MLRHTIEKDIYGLFNRDLTLHTPLQKYPGKKHPPGICHGRNSPQPPPP